MEPHYNAEVVDGIYKLTFTAPKQLLLHPEFEAMVGNECLRRAHSEGHMPIGPIHIETQDGENRVVPLVEGESMSVAPFGGMVSVDLMTVTAQVQIGLSL